MPHIDLEAAALLMAELGKAEDALRAIERQARIVAETLPPGPIGKHNLHPMREAQLVRALDELAVLLKMLGVDNAKEANT